MREGKWDEARTLLKSMYPNIGSFQSMLSRLKREYMLDHEKERQEQLLEHLMIGDITDDEFHDLRNELFPELSSYFALTAEEEKALAAHRTRIREQKQIAAGVEPDEADHKTFDVPADETKTVRTIIQGMRGMASAHGESLFAWLLIVSGRRGADIFRAGFARAVSGRSDHARIFAPVKNRSPQRDRQFDFPLVACTYDEFIAGVTEFRATRGDRETAHSFNNRANLWLDKYVSQDPTLAKAAAPYKVTSHRLRKLYALLLLRQNKTYPLSEAEYLARALGHSSIATTAIYAPPSNPQT
jgi:hypothetical protein